MTEDTTYNMVFDTAEKLFKDQGGDTFDSALWSAAQEAGFTLALLPEDSGGFGFSAREALVPVRVAAAHGVGFPLAETLLANWVLDRAGMDPVDGAASVVLHADQTSRPVPFGRHVDWVVQIANQNGKTRVSLFQANKVNWQTGENHAGEARDFMDIGDHAPAGEADIAVDLSVIKAALATLRSVQLAGATDAVAQMCLGYCNDRAQFGRPLSKFQAVQHQLAILATHSCAATVAADMAIAAFADLDQCPDNFVIIAAAAKIRCAEAATAAASIAHQAHGAIGFSQEYPLHLLTRRLWSWRDENGSEAELTGDLAKWASDLPEGGFWPALTSFDIKEVA